MKYTIAVIFELLFFGVSLVFLVPSNIWRLQKTFFATGVVTLDFLIGGTLFTCYLFLSYLRHADSLITAGIKFLSYLGVACWLYFSFIFNA